MTFKIQSILCVLLLPSILFSQDAFYETKMIVKHEALLNNDTLANLTNAYFNAALIEEVAVEEIQVLKAFIQAPFEIELDYDDFDTYGIEKLAGAITSNRNRKAVVREEDYDLVQACNPSIQVSFEEFLASDTLIFTDRCPMCKVA